MTPEVRDRIDQIRQGIVPEGYKKTKSGILPESWSVRTIAECLERVEHPVEVQANEMYTQIGIRSHGKGLFYKEPVTGDSLGNKSVFWIEPDCFILNIVFAWEQAVGKTTQAEAGMIGSHRFPMYRPINGSIDIDYLISYLLTKRGTDILEAASPGGAGRNRTLGQDRFMKSRIVLPPLDEQKKIAEILSTQDKAIELQERKIEELKRFKKGCLEKMFPRKGQKVPEKRFPGFTDDWEQRKLTEFVEFFSGLTYTPNDVQENGTLVLRSSNVSNGEVVDADNVYVNPQVVNSENVKVGDIVVVVRNGSRSLIGKHAQIKAFMPNTVIGAFMTGIRSECPEFTNALLNTSRFEEEIAMNMGATINQITGYMFSKMEFKVPCLDEQKKIGEYFEKLDNLITLHQRKGKAAVSGCSNDANNSKGVCCKARDFGYKCHKKDESK